jgi:hypothetical protein
VRILSIDPGGTTGYASLDESDVYRVGMIGPGDHHARLWALLCAQDPDLLICEAFNYQRRELDKGVQLELVSKEYIGVCKLYVETAPRGLTIQYYEPPPGQFKKLVTRKWLEAATLWDPKNAPHGMDALAQLIHYQVTRMNRKDLVPRSLR